MLLSSHGRVAARVLAALSLSVMIGGRPVVHATTPTKPVALEPGTTTSDAIVPTAPVSQDTPAAVERGPFGLVVSHDSDLAARWRRLQPVIHVEITALALCRANPKACTPAAARFLSIVDAARARTGLARIGEINRAINLAIRPMSDEAQFDAPDVWMTPLMTFATGAGDCEDYAIAKYVALRQAGVPTRDLRLIILHNRLTREDHAVTAARLDGRWLILDNQRMALLTDSEMRNVTPLLALDSAPNVASPVVASTPVSPVGSTDKNRLNADRSTGAAITVSDVFFEDPGKTAPGLPLTMTA